VRIATWNVNGLRARLEYFGHWIRARGPDVVGLQEVKLTDEQFPHDKIGALGYRAVCHGQKAWNGVAVLVREGADVDVVQQGLPGQEELGARLITARTGGLLFTTVYCPNGKSVGHEDCGRKLVWFDALADHLEESRSGGESLVLCGDFNICPAAIDSWNEEALAGSIFHTDEERERLGRLLGWGLRDLYREVNPDRQAFSWWDYRGGAFHRGYGLRIDLILGTGPVAERVVTADIDRDWRKKFEGLTPSDHAPVVVELS
jgi:exodeoxyribonuclease-3